ncbi:Cytochrome b5 domain-containing protein [Dioscorea alata]|uniref:Cytochrome b5 domain-containing protein n=1 Tax=Dioscorea alata TaxID=55571 RepID=A0ACB7UJF3_DIOAL|nr:Cytochrome b5 domain-containing protein [Dioscorea alata]
MPVITKLYSWKEVSKHNTSDDCWIVVDGKVYDVTKYLDDHPGGDDVLLSATGKDSTEEFEDAGHSKSARELMQEYFIGEIDSSPIIPELKIFTKEQTFTSNVSKFWALPAAIIGVSIVAGILYARKK